MDPSQVGEVVSTTQMGGEGAQFVGIAPFVTGRPLLQNMGEGTFLHSGQLAVRQAVAANVTMTFKILYNRSIAMTGGQQPANVIEPVTMARQLLDEGVRRVVITTDDLSSYRRLRLPPGCSVRHRDSLEDVQDELLASGGVTVLIHDQECATEKRRAHVRGRVPMPARRLVINHRVCENCGDCTRRSNCLSLQTFETEFGPKMSIHQSSCNLDESCLLGDCPSFVSIPAKTAQRNESRHLEGPPSVPVPPAVPHTQVFRMRIAGIGGTGVVTLSQIVATAASLDGLLVSALDQTGLSQKGGPVVSDLTLGRDIQPAGVRLSDASAHLYLALDPATASDPKVLKAVDERVTAAVASTSLLLTMTALHRSTKSALDVEEYLSKLREAVRPGAVVAFDTVAIAEALFASHLPANMIALGAAFQAGYLPIGLESFEAAIRLNGGPVEDNLAAFTWGRVAVALPARVTSLLESSARRDVPSIEGLFDGFELPEGLKEVMASRAVDLVGYQSEDTARDYVRRVAAVSTAERQVAAGADDIATAAARGLYKLTAYKDEYEVARLHLLPESLEKIGGRSGARRARFHLYPPVLRALGMKKKLAVPGWVALPTFRLLVAGRGLRWTAWDPFGYTSVRRCERRALREYQAALELSRAVPHGGDTRPLARGGRSSRARARLREFEVELGGELQREAEGTARFGPGREDFQPAAESGRDS